MEVYIYFEFFVKQNQIESGNIVKSQKTNELNLHFKFPGKAFLLIILFLFMQHGLFLTH